MSTATEFNPVGTPLLRGISLLDASAGTGKTYTIAMLVLRFVVEQAIDIEQILVVTFTKAATEELKDRIRQRLADAKQTLLGKSQGIDANLLTWLNSLELTPDIILQRLELALLDIDQAAIFTIHGFCQRVLNEHALESGQLFDAELSGDVAAIKQGCADDFWRREVYPRPVHAVALLTASYKTPEALLDSVQHINLHCQVYPEAQPLDTLLQQTEYLKCEALSHLDDLVAAVREALAGDLFKKTYSQSFENKLNLLSAWLNKHSVLLPAAEVLSMLTGAGLTEALNGQKFRSNKTQSGEERKADYLASLAVDLSAFDALNDNIKQISIAFRCALIKDLQFALDRQMQLLNVLSFDDLISRLAEALGGENGDWLRQFLQQQFQVALIDEFQDTDQQQWFIFSRLFASEAHSLYLIGDPKQAIYKFRGADIFSYFSAQQQAQHHFTLAYNWRSHPDLVTAVNTLFQREQAFLFPQVNFQAVHAGRKHSDGHIQQAGQCLAPLMLWQLAESNSSSGYWTAAKAATEIAISVVNEIVHLLTAASTISNDQDSKPLLPGDIAILVRSNQQARDYQAYLRAAGVPAVLNNTESVFMTTEAAALHRVLEAIANPADLSLLKQALTLDWFNLSGQQLYQTLNDENALDAWLARFHQYCLDWQKKGFMAMMLGLLKKESVRPHLCQSRFAERRLTNLQHLLELIQQAVVEEHLGMQKTLHWLRNNMLKAEQGAQEDQQLRLESDAAAVKIVTMHRSKGLEYAVVFCPVLWQRHDFLRSEQHLIQCHEQGRLIADLGSPLFAQRRQQALQEELAEELRLAYVALTRAKYRCYLAWADVRTQEQPNRASLAYLLEFADLDFQQQRAGLLALAAEQPEVFAYQLLANENALRQDAYHAEKSDSSLSALQRKRSLYTSWQMSSYTALSALSLGDVPELPEDKVGEAILMATANTADATTTDQADSLPRGLQFGNVIHELLETIPFQALEQGVDISFRREQLCQRYGLKLAEPSRIDQLLQAVVITPLDTELTDFCLAALPAADCLKEMPFYLALEPIDVSRVNTILEACPSFQPLAAKQMSGFLTGFVDLVCVYQGRYYVLDYKTNHLPDYQPQRLIAAMREHNYGLQYWLYGVVLHQYLQLRLPDYHYQQHFGGVRYLFVRGMQAGQAMSGVFADRPDWQRLNQLAELFQGQ